HLPREMQRGYKHLNQPSFRVVTGLLCSFCVAMQRVRLGGSTLALSTTMLYCTSYKGVHSVPPCLTTN
ncbi:MAG: hypothetical protein ACK55Z_27885, partial [bacterium]